MDKSLTKISVFSNTISNTISNNKIHEASNMLKSIRLYVTGLLLKCVNKE